MLKENSVPAVIAFHDRHVIKMGFASFTGDVMQSKIRVGAGVAAVLSLITSASSAWSGTVVFDSLGGTTSSSAFGGGIEPAVAATFKMGRSSARVDVSLLLKRFFS
jgi:hypothetical protein